MRFIYVVENLYVVCARWQLREYLCGGRPFSITTSVHLKQFPNTQTSFLYLGGKRRQNQDLSVCIICCSTYNWAANPLAASFPQNFFSRVYKFTCRTWLNIHDPKGIIQNMPLLAVGKATSSVAISSFDGCAGTCDAASGTVSGCLLQNCWGSATLPSTTFF